MPGGPSRQLTISPARLPSPACGRPASREYSAPTDINWDTVESMEIPQPGHRGGGGHVWGAAGPGGEPVAREGRRPGNVVGARGVVVVVEDVVVVDAVAVVEAVVVGVQRVVTAPGAVLPEELQLLLPTAAVGTVRQPVPCCSPD